MLPHIYVAIRRVWATMIYLPVSIALRELSMSLCKCSILKIFLSLFACFALLLRNRDQISGIWTGMHLTLCSCYDFWDIEADTRWPAFTDDILKRISWIKMFESRLIFHRNLCSHGYNWRIHTPALIKTIIIRPYWVNMLKPYDT